MKNTIRQIFHSSKFIIGFIIFMSMILTMIIYPLIITQDPLEMIANGNFFKPGTYINVIDAVETNQYTLNVDTVMNRLDSKLDETTKADMVEWLTTYGDVKEEEIDAENAISLIASWDEHYDSKADQKGLISARKKYFVRLDKQIDGILEDTGLIIASEDPDTGELTENKTIDNQYYVNTKDIVNKQTFILGTDNFGRDVLTELVAAAKTSLKIGLIAGTIATLIGLIFGLLSGYVGGIIDDFILFITNLFTVIPPFIILILISYSVGQAARGVSLVAVIIGLTSWPWTTRSVRSQVISLRNRDHVNLSKLSGHSLIRIVVTDILPYIASYVVMALILQISSGILAEAQLSMLGLGPATTTTATLGLMMNWAMQYSAHLNGSWWAYFPVVLTIALISFSLNLMNTGLDQVFNPQLRD